MPFFDWIFLAIMAWGLWTGWRKGLARQLTGTIGIGASFTLAAPMAYWLGPFAGGTFLAWVVAFAIIWAGAILAGWQVRELLDDGDDEVEDETILNRRLGIAFGGVKAFTLWLAVCFFLVGVSDRARDGILDSWSGGATIEVLDLAAGVFPEEWHEQIDEYRRAIEGHDHTHEWEEEEEEEDGGDETTDDPSR